MCENRLAIKKSVYTFRPGADEEEMDTLDLVSENEESVFSKINTIGNQPQQIYDHYWQYKCCSQNVTCASSYLS